MGDATTWQLPSRVTLTEVGEILAGDLPLMSEAQIANMLASIYFGEPTQLGELVEPLARAELARRWQRVPVANSTSVA